MGWAQFDAAFEARVADAASRGCVLRYVAAVDVAAGACTVRLQVRQLPQPLALLCD